MFFLEKCVCVFKFVYIDQVEMPRRKNSLIFQKQLGVGKGARSKPRAQGLQCSDFSLCGSYYAAFLLNANGGPEGPGRLRFGIFHNSSGEC